MKVTLVDLRAFDFLASDLVRSPGLHASDIYNDYYRSVDPKRYGRDPDELGPMFMCLGTAWEKHWEFLLQKAGMNFCRPGEFRSKGNLWALSPDLVMFNGHDRIGEIKLTWKSSRNAPTGATNGFHKDYDKYMIQMMDGCNAAETCHARLFITFVNGDYKPPRPETRAYDIEFSARELKEAFDTMVGWAKYRKMI